MKAPIRILMSIVCVMFLHSFAVSSDNMDHLGTFDPNFFAELTDCEYRSDTLFVMGVSGFNIVDVHDLENPELIGRYTPPGHPYTRFYHAAVGERTAYGFARDDGIFVVDFSIPSQPQLVETYFQDSTPPEDGQIHDGYLYVATHSDGVQIFKVRDDGLLTWKNSYTDVENATALKAIDNLLYVADGAGGVLVLNIFDRISPTFVSRIATTSAAQDIDFNGDYGVVAVGALGVDVIDFSDPFNPQFQSNYEGVGSAFNLTVDDNLAYVARWDRVEIIDVADPQNPVLAGWEDTPTRAMGLTAKDSIVYVADWAFGEIYKFGEGNDQDIYIDYSFLNVGFASPNEQIDTIFTVENTGGNILNITEISSSNPEFTVTPTSAHIPEDVSFDFGISFMSPDSVYTTSDISIHSDDPDEEIVRFRASANGSGLLEIGDPAPDFTYMALDSMEYSLSDYLGKIVVLAFFASW
ncbi:MAG: redoxin domain-containing protein [candidate division Zixibacteria bacterium]|nr:redoxin domain-containing protein [candidate division Zixibacteria bacterium]